MDLGWLKDNCLRSWRYRGSLVDVIRRMLWTYSQRLPGFMRRRYWRIGFRYRLPIGELKLVVRDNVGADAFILGEVFEHEYYSLPLADAPRTILDLGSNAGFSAVYFAKVYPGAQLACVEPVPGNLESLAINLELNGVEARTFAAAVDIADGDLWIELAKKDFGHKVASPLSMGKGDTIRVQALSLETILTSLAWDRIGLLKVDIEGHEARLLAENNEWLHRVDAMCIECHEEMPAGALTEIAREFGFKAPMNLRGIWLLSREMGLSPCEAI